MREAREIVWPGCLARDSREAYRVAEGQDLGVQRDARNEGGRATVSAISEHGMADLREVDPDLVLAPCLEPAADDCRGREPLNNLEVRDGALPGAAQGGRAHRQAPGVFDEVGDDRPRVLLDTPHDDGRVDPPRLVRLELRGERFKGPLRLGEDEEP